MPEKGATACVFFFTAARELYNCDGAACVPVTLEEVYGQGPHQPVLCSRGLISCSAWTNEGDTRCDVYIRTIIRDGSIE